MLEKSRLRREARVSPPSMAALAEEAQEDVERVADVLESYLVEKTARTALVYGVGE